MANYQLIFSPTGGTQRVAELLGGSLWNDAEEIDLMDRALEDSPGPVFTAQDRCLVAVPCFGGRVPDPARRRLERMTGGGARTVLAVAYGNRAYDDALLELRDLLAAAGFLPVAAVAAVAEHSLLRQFARGRPDRADAQELAAFARPSASGWRGRRSPPSPCPARPLTAPMAACPSSPGAPGPARGAAGAPGSALWGPSTRPSPGRPTRTNASPAWPAWPAVPARPAA